MNGWQVTVIVWIALDIVLGILLHGSSHRINAWAGMIGKALFVWVLYMGGFFG